MNANDNPPPKPQPTPKARAARSAASRASERYDPFCSKRCADVDLHHWLKGGYVIPGDEAGERESDDEE